MKKYTDTSFIKQPDYKQQKHKKTKLVIFLLVAVIFVLAAVCGIFINVRTRVPDEAELEKMLPDELLKYSMDDEIYTSTLVDLNITDNRERANKYKVYCELSLTDDLMDRTLFVYLEYERDIWKGWELRRFGEYESPVLTFKQEIPADDAEAFLQDTYDYDNITFETEKSTCEGDEFHYAFDIAEASQYIDVSGNVWVTGKLGRVPETEYNDDYGEPMQYVWSYSADMNDVAYKLNAEGMWVGKFTDEQELRLHILSTDDNEVRWECSTRKQVKGTDQVTVADGSSYLYFDGETGEFSFDVVTGAGCYELTFSEDAAELVCEGNQAEAFEMNNDVALETATETATEIETGIASNNTGVTLPDENSEKIYVYSYTVELETQIDLFKEKYPQYADLVEFVNLDMSGISEEYCTMITTAIEANRDDVPSIVAYDSDMAEQFAGSDFIDLKEIGLTDDMYADAYAYTREVATFDNQWKAMTWGAYPVCFIYRADIAEAVLGTSDPEEVANYISDFDTFMDTAEQMKEAGYYMLSGPDDISPIKDVLESKNQYDEIYQKLETGGYTAGTQMWSSAWMDNFQGNVFGYFSAPWFTTWVLDWYAKPDTYRVTNPPEYDYWGGVYLGVTRNCTNNELAALLLYTICCDEDFMAEACTETFDFPNNKVAAEKLMNTSVSVSDFLGGQDVFSVYDKIAEQIQIFK